MRRYRSILMLITILLGSIFAATTNTFAQEEEDSVLKVESAAVFCDLSVRNAQGKKITNLQADDFTIFEDGKPQQIEHFINTPTPLDLVLVFDISGSTNNKLDVMRQAAINFISKLGKSDHVALVQFDERVELLSKFSNDQEVLSRALKGLGEGEGYGSSVYDAMLYAGSLFNNSNTHQAVLMITDGVDNTSRFDLKVVKTMLESLGASFYFIELNTEADIIDRYPSLVGAPFTPKQLESYYRSLSLSDREVAQLMEKKIDQFPKDFIDDVTHTIYRFADRDLQEVAKSLGGRVYKVDRIEQINRQYQEILDELRALYTIGYYPNSNQNEGFHKITIRSKQPNLSLYYRSGYRSLDQAMLRSKLEIISKRLEKNASLTNTNPEKNSHGWTVPLDAQESGYSVKVSEDLPYLGYLSVIISPDGPLTSNKGVCQKSVDASQYWGKYLRFSAYVRLDETSPETEVTLTLKVHRLNQTSGSTDLVNYQSLHYTDITFKKIEVIGEIPEDAENITMELGVQGSGRIKFDTISLDPIGTIGFGDAPPKALTNQTADNLIALTNLLSYVRNLHPSDEAFQVNWELFTIRSIEQAEKAHNARELSERLMEIFQTIAPTVRVFVTKQKPPQLPTELLEPANYFRIISWQKISNGGPGTAEKFSRIFQDPENHTEDQPSPQKPLIIELGGGVSALIPLALYVDGRGTIPQVLLANLPEKNINTGKPKNFIASAKDRTTRLAVLSLVWHQFQQRDHNPGSAKPELLTSLRKALMSAANNSDEAVFHQTLRQLIIDLTGKYDALDQPHFKNIYLAAE